MNYEYDETWKRIPEQMGITALAIFKGLYGVECDTNNPDDLKKYKLAAYFLKKQIGLGLAYRDYGKDSRVILYIKDKRAGTFSHEFKVSHVWNSNVGKNLSTKQFHKMVNNSFKNEISLGFLTKILNDIATAPESFGSIHKVGRSNVYSIEKKVALTAVSLITTGVNEKIAKGFEKSGEKDGETITKIMKEVVKELNGSELAKQYSAEDLTLVPKEKIKRVKETIESKDSEITELKGEVSELLDEVTALKTQLQTKTNPQVDEMDWLE